MSMNAGAEPGTDTGAAAGYRPSRTLPFRVEVARQLRRRRTQVTFGLLVALPVILWIAFRFGGGGPPEDGAVSLADIATAGGLNFAMFTLFASSTFLLVIVAALFAGDTVASEASWGSLRYLLAVPVPRARLLGVKLAVGLASTAAALVLLPMVALGVGTLAYGWEPLGTPLGEQIPAGEATLRLAGIVAYIGISLLPVATLAFLLSVRTDAPLGAVGGAVLLVIVSAILESISALGDLRNLLPTRYNLAWLDLLASPVQTDNLVRGTVSALAYATVFLVLAWRAFLRKDIVS